MSDANGSRVVTSLSQLSDQERAEWEAMERQREQELARARAEDDERNARRRDTWRQAEEAAAATRHLVVRTASTIRPVAMRWAWEGRMPLGEVTLFPGRQGLGKSTLTALIAAQTTRGTLPGDLQGEPADVLLIAYEDQAATTTVPRLMAANADLDRVHVVESARCGESDDLVSLPGDLELLAERIALHRARLVIVDPLVAALPSGEVNAHRDQDVRRALAPLGKMAGEFDCAVLATIHFNKGASTDVLARTSGSIAFTAFARSVLAFGLDPDDPDAERTGARVLAHAKCNVGPLAPSLRCEVQTRTIDDDEGGKIETSALVIVGECDVDANALVTAAPDEEERSARDEAAEFLLEVLGDGERKPSKEIKAKANAKGIKSRTLQRACRQVGVEIEKDEFPAVTYWRLADQSRQSRHEAKTAPLWRDSESSVSIGDSAPPGGQSRQDNGLGATDGVAPLSALTYDVDHDDEDGGR